MSFPRAGAASRFSCPSTRQGALGHPLASFSGAGGHGVMRGATRRKKTFAHVRPRRCLHFFSPCFFFSSCSTLNLYSSFRRSSPCFSQKQNKQNATTWDEIIILPGHFRDGEIFLSFFFFLFFFPRRREKNSSFFKKKKSKGCELVVAAYNHNAIMADDLIGSGGTDLTHLHGAGAGGKMRPIQLFDKNDEPAGVLSLDVVSVDKEGMAGAAAAPAAGAPVGTAGGGLGASTAAGGVGAGAGGVGAAAAPTTPGAVGEVRRTPSGPSAVEAERESAQRTTATTGGAAAAPEGEGVIEKIKRATGLGTPSEPAATTAAAPTSGVTTAAPAVPVSATPARAVPAPRHRELEGEVR